MRLIYDIGCYPKSRKLPTILGFDLHESYKFHNHEKKQISGTWLILYLIEIPFSAFPDRADPDQAGLVKAA